MQTTFQELGFPQPIITVTTYIYSGSKLIATYQNGAAPSSPLVEYIYAGDVLVADVQGAFITYYHQDHLSNRRTSGSAISSWGTYPFGECCSYGGGSQWNFTTYQNDGYAIARYYANRFGRFMSPDPVDGSPGNPQSWNAYAYVQNDPVNSIDPLGLDPIADLFLQYWSPLYYFGFGGGFGSFGGGGLGGLGGGIGDPLLSLLWTPNGYNPCAFGCVAASIPAPFLPPAPFFERTVIYGRNTSQESFADCVKEGGDFFSVRHGVEYVSGGRFGNGWLSRTFFGNTFSDAIGFTQAFGRR